MWGVADDVRAVVTHWLGAEAPIADRLSDAELAELWAAFLAARKRQAAALAAASEEAFRQMPAVVRNSFLQFLRR